ncbi:10896_t:CDS:2, partial [Dentiscutata erythropus]
MIANNICLLSQTPVFSNQVHILETVVRNSPLHSTIKTLELFEQTVKSKNKESVLKGFLRGSGEILKTYKEVYIPIELASVNFLKKTLCVGCYTKGFEIIELEPLNTHGLLHPNDASHDFVQFAFFITKEGWQSRLDFLITWEGTPTSFGEKRISQTSEDTSNDGILLR